MNYDITLPFEGPQGKLGSAQVSDEEVLKKIGSKLKEIRLEKNVKQKELSEKSGLSMFSISQMETGHNTSVQSLVQVLKALDRMDLIAPLMPSPPISPDGDVRTRTRQRVSKVAPFISPEGDDRLIANHHNIMSFSLPENDDYSMAAEDLHRE